DEQPERERDKRDAEPKIECVQQRPLRERKKIKPNCREPEPRSASGGGGIGRCWRWRGRRGRRGWRRRGSGARSDEGSEARDPARDRLLAPVDLPDLGVVLRVRRKGPAGLRMPRVRDRLV